MALNVIIIEDEPATARNLEFLLGRAEPGINVLAITASVQQSVQALVQYAGQYDLIFSDIRLSDGLSFSIFEQVEVKTPVIFVTAYDDYALRAFKANGIDYILKPFDQQEIEKALQKYRQLRRPAEAVLPDMAALVKLLKAETLSYRQSFLVHYRDKLLPVAVNRIAWFYTEHELVYLQTTDNKNYTIEFTLEQLQQQLDPQLFFRANRQFIIQRTGVTEVDFYFNGRLSVKLIPDTPEKVLISKARVPEFRQWMGA